MKQRFTNIYEYNDFRKYLSDYQKSRQSIEKNFSKSEFSRRLRLPHTRSYINYVLKGKEVMPINSARKSGRLRLKTLTPPTGSTNCNYCFSRLQARSKR